jgi:hypothetical protein
MDNAKHFLQSKTFWLNTLTIIGGLILAYWDVVPTKYEPFLLATLGAINVVLRFLTGQPITLTRPPGPV